MPTISVANGVIPGATGRIMTTSGVPGTGTNEVQTLTFGGTPTGGTFTLRVGMYETAAISWSATNSTLVSNIDAALEALGVVGTGGVTTAVGTMTAGIGTITCTFAGTLTAKKSIGTMVATSSLTGTAPTLTVALTTPGVEAPFKGVGTGAVAVNSATGIVYSNTGTGAAPTWAAQA